MEQKTQDDGADSGDGAQAQQPPEQPRDEAQEKRDEREQQRVKARTEAEDRRFWSRVRGFGYRHARTLAIVLAVVVVAYVAILINAWHAGREGNAGSDPRGNYASPGNLQGGNSGSGSSGAGAGSR